jgi:hypothetical protein
MMPATSNASTALRRALVQAPRGLAQRPLSVLAGAQASVAAAATARPAFARPAGLFVQVRTLSAVILLLLPSLLPSSLELAFASLLSSCCSDVGRAGSVDKSWLGGNPMSTRVKKKGVGLSNLTLFPPSLLSSPLLFIIGVSQPVRTLKTLDFGGTPETVTERSDYPLDKLKQIFAKDRFACIGYGPQGRGQALNLRDQGFDVFVGIRKEGA